MKQEPFSDEAIHTEHQAILASEQVLTINIIFSFSGRTNSPKATFISFNLADVCTRAVWETWVSYTRKLNFIYIFITICPYVTRSCVQPEETEGRSILKSKLTDLGYSQDIRPATVVAATTGWLQSKLEWLIQQPEKMQDWGFLPEHYKTRIIFSINMIFLRKHKKQTFLVILPSMGVWTCKYLQRIKINRRQNHDSAAHTEASLLTIRTTLCAL